MDLNDVVDAWKQAKPGDIHPLRNVDEQAYWASGVAQAEHAGQYIPAGGTVLDFGCGDGRIAIPLAKMGFEVTAVDASPTMIGALVEHRKVADVDIYAFISNGLNLDSMVADETQDAVVCRAVLIHHSHADGDRLVKALAKKIKPGGYLIADWPTGTHHLRRDWIDVTVWTPEARLASATGAGLEQTFGEQGEQPSVWRKAGGDNA